jgi:hypothetical protein
MRHQHRENWVRQGFLVLQQDEPVFFGHASRLFDRWAYDPAKCHSGAWACTGGSEPAPIFHPPANHASPPMQPGWSTEREIGVGVAAVTAVCGAFWLGPKVIGAIVAA